MRAVIPDRLKVGGKTWKVVFLCDEDMDALADREGYRVELFGFCDGHRRTIYLSDELEGEHLLNIFIHEVLHCLHFTHDFEVPHEVVNMFGKHGARFLKDNFLKKRRPRRRDIG